MATTLPGARSSTNSDVFLGGNYIELGIRTSGKFGSANSKPVGFFGSAARNPIGMVSDFDGFGNGVDSRIDYFMPGSPEERWVVGYKISGTAFNYSNAGTSIVDQSSGNKLQAMVSGSTPKISTSQVISFDVNDKFFKTVVTLTNTSSDTLSPIRYMRSFDPDNTVDKGGDYDTRNEVLYTYAADGKAVVQARTYDNNDPVYLLTGSRAPILYYSDDSRAKCSIFGFSNGDVFAASAYDTPQAKNNPITSDIAITIAFDLGTLTPGNSVSFSYYTSLDDRDFDEVIEAIQQAEVTPTPSPIPTAAPSPTPTAQPTVPVSSSVAPTPTPTKKASRKNINPVQQVPEVTDMPPAVALNVTETPTPTPVPTKKSSEPIQLQFVDENKQPLAGAVVKLEGDPNEYTTDANGYISIKYPVEKVTAQITHNGKTEEKKLQIDTVAGAKNQYEIAGKADEVMDRPLWQILLCLCCLPLLIVLLIFLLWKRKKEKKEDSTPSKTEKTI